MIADPRPPTLRSRRLRLRPFRDGDAAAVAALVGDIRVSRWMISFAHPFSLTAASAWIERGRQAWLDGTGVTFAITRRGTVTGAVGLRLVARHRHAELGYWLGVPYWGRGFAAEEGRRFSARARGGFASSRCGWAAVPAAGC